MLSLHTIWQKSADSVSGACGATFAHTNDDLSDEQFDGLISVTEDWHARVTLLRVSANCMVYLELYCCNSSLFGSLFYKEFTI